MKTNSRELHQLMPSSQMFLKERNMMKFMLLLNPLGNIRSALKIPDHQCQLTSKLSRLGLIHMMQKVINEKIIPIRMMEQQPKRRHQNRTIIRHQPLLKIEAQDLVLEHSILREEQEQVQDRLLIKDMAFQQPHMASRISIQIAMLFGSSV